MKSVTDNNRRRAVRLCPKLAAQEYSVSRMEHHGPLQFPGRLAQPLREGPAAPLRRPLLNRDTRTGELLNEATPKKPHNTSSRQTSHRERRGYTRKPCHRDSPHHVDSHGTCYPRVCFEKEIALFVSRSAPWGSKLACMREKKGFW